ncbi:hypothetical protein DFP73DRAFT_531865 [Morchella snyderi]|nr:hypothetical protein DFP73DRAFT_531865 [Morchella snyderi]
MGDSNPRCNNSGEQAAAGNPRLCPDVFVCQCRGQGRAGQGRGPEMWLWAEIRPITRCLDIILIAVLGYAGGVVSYMYLHTKYSNQVPAYMYLEYYGRPPSARHKHKHKHKHKHDTHKSISIAFQPLS